MKTDTDKKAFFESLIAASNCDETKKVWKIFAREYLHEDPYNDAADASRFAVDLIDYLTEVHSEDALTALVVARRILNQLSK